MAGKLSTHALDTLSGRPAAGLAVRLEHLAPTAVLLGEFRLDADGRSLLLDHAPAPGIYQLSFAVGSWYRNAGHLPPAARPFLDEVVVRFGIDVSAVNWHVPLVFSPHAYSTYRGS